MSDRYQFQALGPFPVPVIQTDNRDWVDFDRAREAVFGNAQAATEGRYDLREAIGVYGFGLSSPQGKRIRPHYVGKACDQTLHRRVFQPQDKAALYDDVLTSSKRAVPFVFLLPLLTPSGALARLGSNARRIGLAEQNLIGMALQVNPDLYNVKHRVALEAFTIDGVPSGRRSEAATGFGAMLSCAPSKRGVGRKGRVEAASEVPTEDPVVVPGFSTATALS